MSTVDIKKRCPEGRSPGTCQDDRFIQAEKGNLPDNAKGYEYVTHDLSNITWTGELTYDGHPLVIEGDRGTTTFSKKYPNLKEVTTYYYREGEKYEEKIQIPLVLRIHSVGRPYYLYLNKGGDHTKWKSVPLKDLKEIPAHGNTTEYLNEKLKRQTCTLHRLHKIDIRNDGTNKTNPYTCPVCKKAKLFLKVDTPGQPIDYYKKCCHAPQDTKGKIKYPLTYGNDLIKYRERDDKSKSLSVKKGDDISVYYWEGDDKHENPLLIQVKRAGGGDSEWYENDLQYKDKNYKWKKLGEQETSGFSGMSGNFKKKLDDLNCKLNRSVRINLGLDSGCHDSNDHRHKDRIKAFHNGAFNKSPLISAYEYTSKESGEKLFSVAELFIVGYRQKVQSTNLFLKDVTKVISYASFCDPTNPFLIRVEFNNSNENKWYERKTNNTWERKDNDLSSQIGEIFANVKAKLSIKECPTSAPPPKEGVKINITEQPKGGTLNGTYNTIFGAHTDYVVINKGFADLNKGFFRVTHQTATEKSFLLSRELDNGEEIKTGTGMGRPLDVQYVEVYFWQGVPNLPILLGISQGGHLKYYSKGFSWINAGNSNNTLEYLLDEKNCQRNNAIPINLRNPEDPSQLYTDCQVPTSIKETKKISIYSHYLVSKSDYTVKEYKVGGGGARISRVTFDKDTNIDPLPTPVTKIKLYYWQHGRTLPLLVEFISDSSQRAFFENSDEKSLTWAPVGGDEAKKFYKNGPPRNDYTDEITKKLDEVSCRVHHTVNIDVFKKRDRKSYCHDRCIPNRIKVNAKYNTPGYTAYQHTSNIYGETFTVTVITSHGQEQNTSLPYPLRDVKQVTIYFPECNVDYPVAMHIESGGENLKEGKWLKNETGKGNWVQFNPSGENNIATILGKLKVNIPNCEETAILEHQLKSEKAAEIGEQAALESADPTPAIISTDEEEDGYDDITTSMEYAQFAAQGTPGPDSSPAPSNKGSNPPIKTISIITSSVLGASGSITGFAYWIYQRFAGDPWVRQI
ncbi:hypothetical protein BEWA_045610 [Theileria equi strain WA]|uniref:Uncharacterized protein n=1 Tax=Theileria equi strain WA TaxID=1537102 RepID=L1L9J9_THEEQ|nr:hypothetical protein BEWA_045610 [Theileria equi strain WA]EKX72097.1 hypothetical protein BEWA_045610 [Theileria equi strain WA]|eukprot:XP_004831549.1 hypothetical protein BEWA_045610 [Theileria equi strain WA]